MRNDVPYESFEVAICDFCEGTKIDKHFGTTCIECQEYSFEHVLRFLGSMLAIQSENRDCWKGFQATLTSIVS